MRRMQRLRRCQDEEVSTENENSEREARESAEEDEE